MKNKKIKDKIIYFLGENKKKKIYLSDIALHLDKSPSEIVGIIKEMKEEGYCI